MQAATLKVLTKRSHQVYFSLLNWVTPKYRIVMQSMQEQELLFHSLITVVAVLLLTACLLLMSPTEKRNMLLFLSDISNDSANWIQIILCVKDTDFPFGSKLVDHCGQLVQYVLCAEIWLAVSWLIQLNKYRRLSQIYPFWVFWSNKTSKQQQKKRKWESKTV